MTISGSGSFTVNASNVVRGGGRASWVGLFFALTGVLIATSIINFGNSGIGFYYTVMLVPFFALWYPERWVSQIWSYDSTSMFALLGITAASLTIDTWLQIVVHSAQGITECIHLITRLSFLFYFVIIHCALNAPRVERTLVWLRRLLLMVCAYGVYQLPAKLLGLPLFLDWLRNNKSLSMYGYDEAGWIGIVRSTSIFAEPSQATIPIVILFLLNSDRQFGFRYRRLGWSLLLLFTIAGFSRTAWLCLAAAFLSKAVCNIAAFRRWYSKHRFAVAGAFMLLILMLPAWGFLEARYANDLSAQERSQSIALGVYMIKDAPILGYGWNSFHTVAGQYTSFPVNLLIDFSFIHNMVVSYVQQAGIAGLLLAMLPFLIAICWSTAPVWITLSTTTAFLVAAEFGGDLGYSSLVWLWLALLVNWSNINMNHHLGASTDDAVPVICS